MHLITPESYPEAEEAVRDILMMYVDMAKTCRGFGVGADCYIRFDPLKFVDAQQHQWGLVDLDLLRSGSAVAMVGAIYTLWGEDQFLGQPLTTFYRTALDEGRLSAFPDIGDVLREALRRDSIRPQGVYPWPEEDWLWLDQAVIPIYQKYVLGFFRRLADGSTAGRHSPR